MNEIMLKIFLYSFVGFMVTGFIYVAFHTAIDIYDTIQSRRKK